MLRLVNRTGILLSEGLRLFPGSITPPEYGPAGRPVSAPAEVR